MERHPASAAPPVRLQDIARRLALSTSTVSRALAGHTSISESTRAAVQHEAAALGFRFGAGSRRARRPETRTVGLVLDNLASAFLAPVVTELQAAFGAAGYHTTLIADSLDDATQLATFRPLIDGYFDGMVFASAKCDSRIVAELQRRGLPTVVLIRGVESTSIDTVEVDNFQAGAEAARHLRGLGHRRVGLVLGPQGTSTSRDRARGVASVFEAAFPHDAALPCLHGPSTGEHGCEAALALLAGPRAVTAIVAANDTIALGVLEAARRLGVAVPRQLSVIGFDDTPLAASPMARLTSVRQPAEELARTAARRLLARMRSANIGPVTRDVLPTQLIARETTGPAPAEPERRAGPGPSAGAVSPGWSSSS